MKFRLPFVEKFLFLSVELSAVSELGGRRASSFSHPVWELDLSPAPFGIE